MSEDALIGMARGYRPMRAVTSADAVANFLELAGVEVTIIDNEGIPIPRPPQTTNAAARDEGAAALKPCLHRPPAKATKGEPEYGPFELTSQRFLRLTITSTPCEGAFRPLPIRKKRASTPR